MHHYIYVNHTTETVLFTCDAPDIQAADKLMLESTGTNAVKNGHIGCVLVGQEHYDPVWIQNRYAKMCEEPVVYASDFYRNALIQATLKHIPVSDTQFWFRVDRFFIPKEVEAALQKAGAPIPQHP